MPETRPELLGTEADWLAQCAERVERQKAQTPHTFTAADAQRNDKLDVWIGRLCAGALIAFVALCVAGVIR